MNKPLAVIVLVLAVCAAGCGACRTEAPAVPADRLRAIEPFDPAAMSAPETPPSAEPVLSTETSLSLEECRADALAHNLDLKVALLSPTIAAEAVNEAEARFEASLFSGLGFARVDSPPFGAAPSAQGETTDANLGVDIPLRTGGTLTFESRATRFDEDASGWSSDFAASISHPLLRGAGPAANCYEIRVARYESQISQAEAKLSVMRVISELDRTYWRTYAARRELDVRRNEHSLAVAQLERARRRVQAGAAGEVEITRAETGVAEKLEAVILAENAIRQSERDLKRAINRPGLPMDSPTAVITATPPDPVHYRLDGTRLVAAGVANRMEMLEVELQIARDAATIDFARNDTLPYLALDYTYGASGRGADSDESFTVLNEKRYEDHTVSLTLDLPLGNAAARSRLRQALASRIQRLATRELRRSQIEQEVLNALDELETSWQRLLANRQRTILAARNLDAETRQYELGLRTSTDVLDAQTRLANAQSAEISSLVDYQVAQIDLAYATGTLLGAAKIRWEPAPIDGDAAPASNRNPR